MSDALENAHALPGIPLGKWLTAHLASSPPRAKMLRWWISSQRTGAKLGVVQWYSHWRQYVFSPNPGCIFNRHCLRLLADFCEEKTKEHRAGT